MAKRDERKTDRRQYSEAELAFMRAVAKYARLADISSALGKASANGIRKALRRHGIVARQRGQQPMSRAAVKEAWRRAQAGQPLTKMLMLWSQGAGRPGANKKKLWTPGDDDLLREMLGHYPLAEIALKLRRTRIAVRDRIRDQKLTAQWQRCRLRPVAAQLRVTTAAIRYWINRGYIRAWHEGRWLCLHADDVDWLLQNYRWCDTDWVQLREDVPLEVD